MLYQLVLRSADRMDQHVSSGPFAPHTCLPRACTIELTGCTNRMSLQSALIGFLLSRLLRKPMSPQENVVLQTTAVATGTVSVACIVLTGSAR